ncbi:MAG: hypothetical protein ACOYMD_08055 [Paludibacter sp.]
MRKIIVLLVAFFVFGTLLNSVFCQVKVPEPYILSIAPDSLFAKYDYSQIVFVVVSIPSTFGKDPTEKGIEELKKQIIANCKLNKFDGFILNQMVFTKPFDEGKLIGYGTLIRKKTTK